MDQPSDLHQKFVEVLPFRLFLSSIQRTNIDECMRPLLNALFVKPKYDRFISLTETEEEISLIMDEATVEEFPSCLSECNVSWRAIAISLQQYNLENSVAADQTSLQRSYIASQFSKCLSVEGISIIYLSTCDKEIILVDENCIDRAFDSIVAQLDTLWQSPVSASDKPILSSELPTVATNNTCCQPPSATATTVTATTTAATAATAATAQPIATVTATAPMSIATHSDDLNGHSLSLSPAFTKLHTTTATSSTKHLQQQQQQHHPVFANPPLKAHSLELQHQHHQQQQQQQQQQHHHQHHHQQLPLHSHFTNNNNNNSHSSEAVSSSNSSAVAVVAVAVVDEQTVEKMQLTVIDERVVMRAIRGEQNLRVAMKPLMDLLFYRPNESRGRFFSVTMYGDWGSVVAASQTLDLLFTNELAAVDYHKSNNYNNNTYCNNNNNNCNNTYNCNGNGYSDRDSSCGSGILEEMMEDEFMPVHINEGPLGFDETGIVSSLATPLYRADISPFLYFSTFLTDYALIPVKKMVAAVDCLQSDRFEFDESFLDSVHQFS